MRYKDGSVYDGYWKDDKRDGDGTMTYLSGHVYKGQFFGDIIQVCPTYTRFYARLCLCNYCYVKKIFSSSATC